MVPHQEIAADEDGYDPAAAPEIMPQAYEEADGDEQHLPGKEPVREGEAELIEEQDPTHQEEEEPSP